MSVKEYLVVDRLHCLSLCDRCNHVVSDAEASTESEITTCCDSKVVGKDERVVEEPLYVPAVGSVLCKLYLTFRSCTLCTI